jgi:2-dehydro-3-deoxygluconokinase
VRALRAEGVDVGSVQRGGERIGIYFVETGASQRPSSVVYDRAHSALSELEAEGIPWNDVLSGASWFHTSGITPALGKGAAASTKAALATARKSGARVSFDINFRRKLGSEEEAARLLRPLMQYVQVLIANEHHLTSILGIPREHVDDANSRRQGDVLRTMAERVVAEHGVEQVAITQRENLSASANGWSAVLYDAASKTLHRGPRYLVQLVDRIGGGDAFAAGLIFAQMAGRSAEQALRFAIAAGALKLTVVGDFNRVSAEEVDRLVAGEEGGRVSR